MKPNPKAVCSLINWFLAKGWTQVKVAEAVRVSGTLICRILQEDAQCSPAVYERLLALRKRTK